MAARTITDLNGATCTVTPTRHGTVEVDAARGFGTLDADLAARFSGLLALAADEARGHKPFSLADLRDQLGLQDKSDEYLNAGLDRLADAVLGCPHGVVGTQDLDDDEAETFGLAHLLPCAVCEPDEAERRKKQLDRMAAVDRGVAS